jgi:class 3 adenylate cyclase
LLPLRLDLAGAFGARLQRLAASPSQARVLLNAIVEEIEEFLTGGRSGGELVRALLTVMFTDIVEATACAARLGDGRLRDLLAEHDARVREQLACFGGREIKTVGDGLLATFDGPPSRALRCSLAITAATRVAGERLFGGEPARRSPCA